MAKKNSFDSHIESLLAQWDKTQRAKKEREKHKQAVEAGKELAQLCVLLKESGVSVTSDVEVFLAGFLKEYPKAVGEVVAYYQMIKDVPALVKVLISGISCHLAEGRLMIEYQWRSVSDSEVVRLVEALAKRQEEA